MNTLFKHLVAIVIAIFIGEFSLFGANESKGKEPSSYSIHGIDVSHYQETIDWEKVSTAKLYNGKKKVAINFVFVKATEGKTTVDPFFHENWKKLENAQIIRGAYHIYSSKSTPEEQAENFISTVALEPGDLPPVLDIEENFNKSPKDNFIKGVKNWLSIVKKHYGISPIIYCSINDHETYFDNKDFKEYPFWIAHYVDKSLLIKEKWRFWQYKEEGNVAGITEKVSFDAFKGSIDKLKELCLSPSFQGGIDVSRHNGEIDWEKVSRIKVLDGKNTIAINFAFVKATEGGNWLDPLFRENWENLDGQTLRGAYHIYKYNSKATPEEQAQNFISNVDLKSGDLPPVLALPVTGKKPDKENILPGIKSWLATVENEYGVKPIIFCSDTDYKAYFNTNDFDNYLFWIQCDDNHFQPNNKQWRFWQKSEKHVKGINGSVNFNLFNGTLKELKELRLNDD